MTRRVASITASLLLAAAPACGGDDHDDDSAAGSSSTATATSDGSTSGGATAGPIYGPCDALCTLDLDNACIKPGDGAALEFCTKTCDDAASCPASPGVGAPACIDAGGGPICALSCSAGACPMGMTCKLVATAGGSMSLCFNPT